VLLGVLFAEPSPYTEFSRIFRQVAESTPPAFAASLFNSDFWAAWFPTSE
jgi:hypothetical protein